ncbi:MAG: FIST C-terminal domain-containing protein [Lachnospiraceae bacterium]|nr:FIST C-terminal domain-containing protein [Lachnospiraceae bacterium]
MIKSTVLYTGEIDDLEVAAEELFSQAAGFEFKDNSLAIIFMDAETEYSELYEMLKEKWTFPIVAVTTIGILTGNEGYSSTGISIMLLTSSDSRFSVGMTDALSVENYHEKIKEAYERIEKDLDGEEVKLVLTYGAKAPLMAGDDIVNAVDALGKNVKVYGAFAADMFNYKLYRVALNDKIAADAQVFILISGNLDPKFLSVKSLSGKANFSYEVTEANQNIVFKLGSGTFIEALEKAGLSSDKDMVAGEFIQTPFVTVLERPGGMRVETLRNLTYLNHENGSGMFIGGMEEGSSLELGLINRDDVKTTVTKAFDDIFEWLGTEGKDCGTLICNSCTARFLVLGNNGVLEAETYQGRIPEGVSLMGMYSYGEFCPVGDDKWCNLFHNSTFTILCF